MQEKIIILDFGAPTTQLIGRRVRELNVYCEIVPYNKFPEDRRGVKGVILGSPSAVFDKNAIKTELSKLAGQYPIFEITETDSAGQNIEALSNFLDACGCKKDWTPASFIEHTVAELKEQIAILSKKLEALGSTEEKMEAERTA